MHVPPGIVATEMYNIASYILSLKYNNAGMVSYLAIW